MKLFDSHCHINDRAFAEDYRDVIRNAKQNDVQAAMIVGTNKKSSQIAVKIANETADYYAAVGVHPHDAKQITAGTLEYLKTLAGDKKVKAWGEIGLDFNRLFSPQDVQEKYFIQQLKMAGQLELPVIFHERDTGGRFLEVLKACHTPGSKGVVHCFGGTKQELLAYLDMGYCIGITGIITLKGRGENLQQLVKLIPRDRILIETDCPYLTPYPDKLQTKRNEPAFVKSVLKKIAVLLNEEPQRLSEQIWNNTCRLFNLEELRQESLYDQYLINPE